MKTCGRGRVRTGGLVRKLFERRRTDADATFCSAADVDVMDVDVDADADTPN